MVHVNTDVIRRRPRPYIMNGDKILRLRKLAGGGSQDHFAGVAGISRRYWIQLETGEKLPSGVVRDKMCAALGCDSSEIQSSDDEDEESDPVAALMNAIRIVVRAEIARETGVEA